MTLRTLVAVPWNRNGKHEVFALREDRCLMQPERSFSVQQRENLPLSINKQFSKNIGEDDHVAGALADPSIAPSVHVT